MKPPAVLPAISITLLLISGGTRVPAQGRATTFERYTLDDGLSNNVATAFTQDRFGFVWIVTGRSGSGPRVPGWTDSTKDEEPSFIIGTGPATA